MALSQAQVDVKRLVDVFITRGARVRFANHPVSGRMPGHMNVLLCEADVPYEMLFEMDDRPGYAGVPIPLYTDAKTIFIPGDAKASIQKLMRLFQE